MGPGKRAASSSLGDPKWHLGLLGHWTLRNHQVQNKSVPLNLGAGRVVNGTWIEMEIQEDREGENMSVFWSLRFLKTMSQLILAYLTFVWLS
jgi:hypothetical protein